MRRDTVTAPVRRCSMRRAPTSAWISSKVLPASKNLACAAVQPPSSRSTDHSLMDFWPTFFYYGFRYWLIVCVCLGVSKFWCCVRVVLYVFFVCLAHTSWWRARSLRGAVC